MILYLIYNLLLKCIHEIFFDVFNVAIVPCYPWFISVLHFMAIFLFCLNMTFEKKRELIICTLIVGKVFTGKYDHVRCSLKYQRINNCDSGIVHERWIATQETQVIRAIFIHKDILQIIFTLTSFTLKNDSLDISEYYMNYFLKLQLEH